MKIIQIRYKYMTTKNNLSARWGILAVGVLAMLFAGIIYAWSILKAPLASELGYQSPALALNFTLTMSFFCIGGLISSFFVRKIGTKYTLMLAGAMALMLVGCGGSDTTVLKDMKVEKIILAEEIKTQNPAVLRQVEELFAGQNVEVEFVSHVELKDRTFDCKAVIRTGETTPYANIILQSGCIFA